MGTKRSRAEGFAGQEQIKSGTVVHSQVLRLDWSALVATTIHPIKVAILEAMVRLGEPVSPAEIKRMIGEPPDVSLISYHMHRLVELGIVEVIKARPVRGALETFYFLTPLIISDGIGKA